MLFSPGQALLFVNWQAINLNDTAPEVLNESLEDEPSVGSTRSYVDANHLFQATCCIPSFMLEVMAAPAAFIGRSKSWGNGYLDPIATVGTERDFHFHFWLSTQVSIGGYHPCLSRSWGPFLGICRPWDFVLVLSWPLQANVVYCRVLMCRSALPLQALKLRDQPFERY
jgi:hypothetical protein